MFGLRSSGALRLSIEDVNFAARTLQVRGGKGGKDGVGFFGAETAAVLRAWLPKRRDARPEDARPTKPLVSATAGSTVTQRGGNSLAEVSSKFKRCVNRLKAVYPSW